MPHRLRNPASAPWWSLLTLMQPPAVLRRPRLRHAAPGAGGLRVGAVQRAGEDLLPLVDVDMRRCGQAHAGQHFGQTNSQPLLGVH